MASHVGKHGAASLFARLLFALVVAGLLGLSVSAMHSKPASAAGCGNWQYLNSDTQSEDVADVQPPVSFTITVHTELLKDMTFTSPSTFCGHLEAEISVSLNSCFSFLGDNCVDQGTARAYVVGTNGQKLVDQNWSISLSAPPNGSSPTVTHFTSLVSANCGAAGGTYTTGPITSGSAQRCG